MKPNFKRADRFYENLVRLKIKMKNKPIYMGR